MIISSINNNEMLSHDGLIINYESDEVNVSDHNRTYAQVAAHKPAPKKAQLFIENFVEHTVHREPLNKLMI